MSDDVLDWLSRLPKLEGYTENDRYHDFRKVFSGNMEGQRVLRYIVERGGVFHEPNLVSPVDPGMLAAQRGKRQLALEILAFVNNEPKAKPQRATRKPAKP